MVLGYAGGLDESGDQIVFDGPELGASRVPLAHTQHVHTQRREHLKPGAQGAARVCTCMP